MTDEDSAPQDPGGSGNNDTRYSQFLCPMTNRSGVSQYRNSCPLIPA